MGAHFGSLEVHSVTLTLTLFHTPESMKCDSHASFLARTFVSPCFGHKPKVRVAIKIKEMVIATIEIERVLGDLGATPYDPHREEKDEDATRKSSIDKQLSMLNETLIHFFRESGNRGGASVSSTRSTSRCQLCQVDDHIVVPCLKHNDMRPKCSIRGGGHRVENYGIRCSFCNGLGHSKDR
jgi:hypothetical protein